MDESEALCAALANLPGAQAGKSRFGAGANPAWRVGGREFAHLHSETEIDLRLPRVMQAELRGDPRVKFRSGRSEWVALKFHTLDDVAFVVQLARAAAKAARNPKETR